MGNFEVELRQKPLKDILLNTKVFDELLPFDEYHLLMAQTDFRLGIHNKKAVKTYFYRLVPFGASYIISAGLSAFLAKVDNFSYKQIIKYIENKGYNKDFIDYLKTRDKIKVSVYSLPENVPAFPHEPIIILETTLFDARILEGILLSELNFASLSATKWHRILNVSEGCPVMEFGRRRAQNSLKASLYSYIAGVNGTSNCEANNLFGIPSSGTMGHEFVQSFNSEFEAFDKWLEMNPEKPCILIDTINTLESGIHNAVKAFKKNEENLKAHNSWNKVCVRIDSGDLAYLAVQCYHTLRNELNTKDVTVVLSNDLDEYSVQAIFTQLSQAGETELMKHLSFGIGTKAVTAWGDPALGGVCKISEIDEQYILKISNHNEKTTIPGNIRSSIVTDNNGQYVTTLIYSADEDYKRAEKFIHINDDSKFIENNKSKYVIHNSRQQNVYNSDGVKSEFIGIYGSQSIDEIRKNSESDLKSLDWSYKRIVKPHMAKVSLSEKLFNIRRYMMRNNIMQISKDFKF